MYIVDHPTKEQMMEKYRSLPLLQLKNEKSKIEKFLKQNLNEIFKHDWTFEEVTAKPHFVLMNTFNFWWDLYREIITLIVLAK